MINEVIEEEGSSSIEMLEKLIEITKADQEELISDPESVNLILKFLLILSLVSEFNIKHYKDHFKFDDDIVANKKVHEIILGLVMDNLATAAESVVEEKEMDNDVLEMNIDITSGDGEASGASNATSLVDQRKNRMFYEPYQQESDSHQQYINSNVVIIVQFQIIPYF